MTNIRIFLFLLFSVAAQLVTQKCAPMWSEEWTLMMGKTLSQISEGPSRRFRRSNNHCVPVLGRLNCKPTSPSSKTEVCEVGTFGQKGYQGVLEAGTHLKRCVITFTRRHSGGYYRIFAKDFSNTCKTMDMSTTSSTTVTTGTTTTTTTTTASTTTTPTTTSTTKPKTETCSLECLNGACTQEKGWFGRISEKCICNEGFSYNSITKNCEKVVSPPIVIFSDWSECSCDAKPPSKSRECDVSLSTSCDGVDDEEELCTTEEIDEFCSETSGDFYSDDDEYEALPKESSEQNEKTNEWAGFDDMFKWRHKRETTDEFDEFNPYITNDK